ncbi:ABC transporter permease [Mageeibacillus indolicus]|uniref:ABC transporter permease n=1 Tax=Mageeibacillus indolicus TaxID=884684 RepID=UPI0004DCB0A7|nr:ABC transporter permease [Mageeibacillus indolicus]KFA57735.1 taurine ABC transporter permease [Mageeibacillus indolicus 0009-5]
MKILREKLPIAPAVWLGILAVWFGYTALVKHDSVMIPSPLTVWRTFIYTVQNGYGGISLGVHLRSSFVRLFLALLTAFVTAVPLGFLSGYIKWIQKAVDSLVQFYRPIPPLAYYPLLILWLGIDDRSKVMLLYLSAFAPLYIACVAAIGGIRRDYILSAKSLGANTNQILKYIIWPACQPALFTGLRTAFGFAYSTLVATEMTAATSGVGWMVMDASRYLKSDIIFMGIIIMGVTGLVIDRCLYFLEKHLVFWKGKS